MSVCVAQHYLYELVIKTLVQNNLFYMLHQFLQYHVLSDSKPLVSSHLSPAPGKRREVQGSVHTAGTRGPNPPF